VSQSGQWRGLRGQLDRRRPGAGSGLGRTTGADQLWAGVGVRAAAGKPKLCLHISKWICQ